MKAIGTPALAVTLSLMIGVAYAASSQRSDWKLVQDNNEIKIHVRKVAGSRIKEFRASTDIKTSLGALVALLDDTPSYTSWMKSCMESRLLERISLKQRVTYVQTKAPLFRKRDAIVYSSIDQDRKTGTVTIELEGVPDFMPEQPGFVRIKELRGYWQFIPLENGLKRVIYQLYVVPGGKLSNWGFLVNPGVKSEIYHILLNLRKFVKRARYQQARYESLKEVDLQNF